ncbi:hypothetical protein [Arthrobacter sp. U41]|uniref:hypothetical protein n=1 Tax=Arthrobacter sp. U41 TaxID=1849032 RepID=UPI0008595FE5|nr:hypothetical protein [Arthrobacter sp. U41]AOT02255.1 hypothetical protein ASPU41_01745 [Arthrobacter sp. U41]
MGDGQNDRTFFDRLRVVGQQGEVLAFMRNLRLETQKKAPPERAAMVKDQYERERARVLQWLRRTDSPGWWDGASEQDVFDVFGVSSTWKDDSAAAAAADRRIRQGIRHKYGVNAVALDTTPPRDAEAR